MLLIRPAVVVLLSLTFLTGCGRQPEKPRPSTAIVPPSAVAADPPELIQQLEATGVTLLPGPDGRILRADCRNADLVDSEILLFAKLPALEILSLENSQVTDAGLAALSQISNLKDLSLRRCAKITDAGIPTLARLPKLERLHLLFTLVTNDGVKALAGFHQLRLLDLRGCKRVNDDGLQHLAGLTRLVDLKFSNYEISNAGLRALAGLTELRVLSLEGCSIDDAGLAVLSNLKQLAILNLDQTQATDAGMKHLQGLPLRDLSGLGTVILGPGLKQLTVAKDTLEGLDLSETSLENEGLAVIATFPRMQRLTLIKGSFDDTGLASLSKLGELKLLDISDCSRLTPAAVTTLARFTQLRSLKLAATDVDDSVLNGLDALTSLSELNVSATKVSREGIAAFQKRHPQCKITN